jgi:hypothetical protein
MANSGRAGIRQASRPAPYKCICGLTGIFVYVLKKEAIANCFLKKFLKNQFLNT